MKTCKRVPANAWKLETITLTSKGCCGTDGTDPVWSWKHFEIVEWSEPREQNKQSVAKNESTSRPSACRRPARLASSWWDLRHEQLWGSQ